MCIRLMRQSISNDPLNDLEERCVQEIMLYAYKEPVLHLVSFAVLKFSQLLSFLPFQGNRYSTFKGLSLLKIEDAWNIYQLNAFQGFTHPRRTLKSFEINMIFGTDQETLYQKSTLNLHYFIPEIEEKNWKAIYNIRNAENELIRKFAFLQTKESESMVNPEKFLQGKTNTQYILSFLRGMSFQRSTSTSSFACLPFMQIDKL